MNTHAKGNRKELLARKKLEAEGWTILFKSQSIKFGKVDFGPQKEKDKDAAKFDIVACRIEFLEGAINGRRLMIKTKARLNASCKHFGKGNNYLSHQKNIIKFKEEHGLENERFELWLWKSPRWTGRVPNKVWNKGEWKVIQL